MGDGVVLVSVVAAGRRWFLRRHQVRLHYHLTTERTPPSLTSSLPRRCRSLPLPPSQMEETAFYASHFTPEDSSNATAISGRGSTLNQGTEWSN